MTTPTDRQIRTLLAPLHDLARRPQPDGPTTLDHLEQRILDACHRNQTGDVRRRDGYPSGGGPGDGGQDAPGSSTEAAAFSNLGTLYDENARATRDQVDDIVESIHVHLAECANHLGALRTQLDRLDKISDPRRPANPSTACKACERIVECTSADPIRKGYCGACANAWHRWKASEEDAGRLPDRVRFEHWRRQQLAA